MNKVRAHRAFVVCLLAVVASAVSGCGSGSGSPQIGAGMMGNGATPMTTLMTGAPPGYRYSSLSCTAPSSLPARTVDVTLTDMGMTQIMGGVAPMGSVMMLRVSPTTVSAGQITLVASNLGWRTHELVVLPLSGTAQAGQRIPDAATEKVSETGSLGEASGSCTAGTGEGIEAGSVGWVSITLPAGRYELVCNLQNHYADGMHQELVVT